MRYVLFTLSIGFLVLDILPLYQGDLPYRSEVRGKSDSAGEDSEDKEYVSEEGIVYLESGMDILDLIKAVSEIKDQTYIIDSSVKPKEISIITPEGGMRKEDVLELFDTILRLNGLAVIKSDGINKVINSDDISGHGTPVKTDNKD